MALLGVAACDDRHPVVMPAAQLSEENDVRWTALNLPQDSIFEDPPQLDLARKLPSFAGVYYDETRAGQLVISLTREEDLPAAEALVRQHFSSYGRKGRSMPASDIAHRIVRYSFLELARYRTVMGHRECSRSLE
jgi:hypothetical protein